MSASNATIICCAIVGMLLGILGHVAADDAVSTKPFVLNPALIDQARKGAAFEIAKPRDVRQRRPKGLEQLQTPEEISQAVDRAMDQLASPEWQELSLASNQLRYLGEHAFAKLAEGAQSKDETIAVYCMQLLMNRGAKSTKIFEGNLKSTSKKIAETAVKCLAWTQDPDAIPALIDALDNEPIRKDVVELLVRFHDPRAIEPLQRWSVTYRREIASLQQEQRPDRKLAPADQFPRRQICRDAHTLAGEDYGPQEAQQIVELLDLRYPGYLIDEASRALIHLRERTAVPAVIQTIRKFRQSGMLLGFLAQVPTPEAVDFLMEDIQSPDRYRRSLAVDAVCQARWGIPLLIGLLDDPEFLARRRTVSGRYSEVNWKFEMPATHYIYDRLYLALLQFGLTGQQVSMTSAHTSDLAKNFRIHPEIAKVKAWWAESGEDFLQGKKVPSPNLTRVTDGLK